MSPPVAGIVLTDDICACTSAAAMTTDNAKLNRNLIRFLLCFSYVCKRRQHAPLKITHEPDRGPHVADRSIQDDRDRLGEVYVVSGFSRT
jgi:hypothetical protein